MHELLMRWSNEFVSTVWGLPLVISLIFAGIFFTIYMGFPQLRLFKHSIDILRGKYTDPDKASGDLSHFQALCTALSATLGLGNIAGVAIAISIGGPGAIFWMWVAGIIGMTTKFTEVTLAVKYREISPQGKVHGGPMFTIKNGLSKRFYPLAWLFAFFTIISSFGAGNMFQANQMASALHASLSIPHWASGLIFASLIYVVIIGGVERIGKIASNIVPFMIFIYLIGAIVVIITNIENVPHMFYQIFHDAFNGTSATGGFAGVIVKEVVIQGIRRASFSNEAGMGSSAMAHAAAKSTPAKEGIVALLEPFIDTVIVCSITALAILSTDVWMLEGVTGSELTTRAFEQAMGITGRGIVTLTVVLFAFSTIISWSYYGEQGVTFVFGEKFIPHYRYFVLIFLFLGSILQLDIVLNFADGIYGLLAVPNLIACFLLLPVVKKELNTYTQKLKNGEIKRYK